MKQTDIGLSRGEVDRAFPFHFAIDDDLRIIQIGPVLARMAPEVAVGVSAAEVIRLIRPATTLSRDALAANADYPFLIEIVRSGTRFRGQFMWLTTGHWIFLGSPWFESADSIERAGLSLRDFAIHDPVVDLLMLGQTQRVAMDDLINISERLQRKKTELTYTEELYRRAIGAANAVPFRKDLASGAFEFIGESIEALTGFEAAEMTPDLWRSLIRESVDVTPTMRVGVSGYRSAAPARRVDHRIETRSGQTRWINESSVNIDDEHGHPRGVIGILYDITELKLAEQRLRKSEEESRRLAMVAARTDNAVILTDVERRIQWVNEGFTRLTGYTLEEVRGRVPGHILQGPESDPATIELMRNRLAEGRGFRCEVQNRAKDGHSYWVNVEVRPIHDLDGRRTGFMAIEADVTARKSYEDRLQQLSTELDTILKLSPDGFVAFDARGRLSYCNPAFEGVTGHQRHDLRGASYAELDEIFADICDPRQRPTSILSLDPQRPDLLELVKPRKLILNRTVREIRNARGQLNGRVLFLRDITQQKEVERMKTEFLAVAAHELRTPMTSIQGFSELLMSDDLDQATIRDLAGTIHRQSSVLVTLVNELLDLQRIDARRGRDFVLTLHPLQKLMRDSIARLRIKDDPRRVELHDLPETAVPVRADADQIGLALTNVLSNAYKYSPGGGEISMSLTYRSVGGSRQVGIVVRDHGIGMSTEHLGRLFERFYRADPSGAIPGTGLGMSIVKEIVELHGGQVEVESALGSGTTVRLWLPQAA